jgi:broad specificity phosphatase PhoE
VNKQSRYAELTRLGRQQVLRRVVPMIAPLAVANSVWIWPAIHSCSYQTGGLLADALGVGQSRLVPEYSFLDPRGLGSLDGQLLSEVEPVIRAGDQSSSLWKPPRGFDGTPNESVQDVMVRVRQVLSITETQFDEEMIVFVAPDSSVLSILQAAVQGIDLRDHWKLAYRCVPACPSMFTARTKKGPLKAGLTYPGTCRWPDLCVTLVTQCSIKCNVPSCVWAQAAICATTLMRCQRWNLDVANDDAADRVKHDC